MKRDLTTLYDHLFETMDLLKSSSATALEMNIKRATAIRQTAQAVIDAAKLEVQVHRLKKTAALDGLFPDLKEIKEKQLGSGDESGRVE